MGLLIFFIFFNESKLTLVFIVKCPFLLLFLNLWKGLLTLILNHIRNQKMHCTHPVWFQELFFN